MIPLCGARTGQVHPLARLQMVCFHVVLILQHDAAKGTQAVTPVCVARANQTASHVLLFIQCLTKNDAQCDMNTGLNQQPRLLKKCTKHGRELSVTQT